MVAQRYPQRMSVDEWRKLEQTSHDIRHEYIDGRVYAMSGGSLAHSRISLTLCNALESALAAAGKHCYVYNSDAAACVTTSILFWICDRLMRYNQRGHENTM